MEEKTRMIYCDKCGGIFRRTFYEGDRYEIECECGNIIKGEL
jgi:hypothetical protein